MLRNYNDVQGFVEDFISGQVNSSISLEGKIEVSLNNKIIPMLSTMENKSSITTVEDLIECLNTIRTSNTILTNDDIQYRDISSDIVQEDTEDTYISYYTDTPYPIFNPPVKRIPSKIYEDWYKSVLQGNISYKDALMNNPTLLHKQRVIMFINHLVYGKHSLMQYIRCNASVESYQNTIQCIIDKKLQCYINNDLENDIINYKNDSSNYCPINTDELYRQLPDYYRASLEREYCVDMNYLTKGVQMLCQLYNPDIDVNKIELDDILYSVLKLVDEFCTYNKYTNRNALFTAIFSRGLFSAGKLPKDKSKTFSSEIFVKEYSTFGSLQGAIDLYVMFDSMFLANSQYLVDIKECINNFLKSVISFIPRTVSLCFLLDTKMFNKSLNFIGLFTYYDRTRYNLVDYIQYSITNIPLYRAEISTYLVTVNSSIIREYIDITRTLNHTLKGVINLINYYEQIHFNVQNNIAIECINDSKYFELENTLINIKECLMSIPKDEMYSSFTYDTIVYNTGQERSLLSNTSKLDKQNYKLITEIINMLDK